MRILKEAKVIDKKVFDDLELSIEVNAGDTRSGVNKKGEHWENTVTATYGYIRGTNSPDGEELDFWLKANPKEGKRVYVMHQLVPDGSKYDEDKVMLGFSSKDEAIRVFKQNVFKPETMYGGCSEFDMEHFKVIAYQASNSSAMLASQKIFDEFTEKGLLKKTIKSPIQVSMRVKESFMRIKYNSSVLSESAFDLVSRIGIKAKKISNDLVFETTDELRKFIKLIQENDLEKSHLGNLVESLPSSVDQLMESNLSDALDDLKAELKSEMTSSQMQSLAKNIADDYGVDLASLYTIFKTNTKSTIYSWPAYRDAKKATEKVAADNKAKEKAREIELARRQQNIKRSEVAKAAAATRAANRTHLTKKEIAEYANILVDYVNSHLGDVFPDGEWYDVLENGLKSEALTWANWHEMEDIFYKIWRKTVGTSSPNATLASYYKDMAADQGWDPNRNPYGDVTESIELDNLLTLAGVNIYENKTNTVSVLSTKRLIENQNKQIEKLTESYLVSTARKNSLLETKEYSFDTTKAVLSFFNTTLKHPTAPAQRVLEAVATKLANNESHALEEHLNESFGLSVSELSKAILSNNLSNSISLTDLTDINEAIEIVFESKVNNKADATNIVLKNFSNT